MHIMQDRTQLSEEISEVYLYKWTVDFLEPEISHSIE